MKWLQAVRVNGANNPIRLGYLDESRAHILRTPYHGIETVLDLLEASDGSGFDVQDWLSSAVLNDLFDVVDWASLNDGTDAKYRVTYPVTPPEVWGCGVTYRRSADFREEGSGIYDHVYVAPRPELFFKATASRCVGHGEPIGRRSDSRFTAAEPEVAIAIGASGRVLGYALANDVSAWDIERENPLYLPQSKIYRACFAFGPWLVTPDEISDPLALQLTCRVTRQGQEMFRGSASTADLQRTFSTMVDCLRHSNVVPTGTILATGTGIIQPLTTGLEPGDVVSIACPELGELRNSVVTV
jgi:2-dehydro-3-deoxy-D-arabinonate dehydratase